MEFVMEPADVGGCQNCDPFLGPYNNTAPNIQGTQKGTIILTTTHVWCGCMVRWTAKPRLRG